MATFNPRDLKRRPREAVVMPLPSPEATPPVTKMNLVSFTTGSDANRPHRRDRRFASRDRLWEAPETVEPAERRGRRQPSGGPRRHPQGEGPPQGHREGDATPVPLLPPWPRRPEQQETQRGHDESDPEIAGDQSGHRDHTTRRNAL